MLKGVPTADEFWVIFAKSREEWDRGMTELRERFEETDRRFEETDRRLEKWQKKVDQAIARIGRAMGTVVEEIIASRLWEKFQDFPYQFEQAFQFLPVYDNHNRTLTDIDILLCNGEYAMAVEIKAHLEVEDVNYHLKQMEMIQQYPPAQAKEKILLGAVGGANIDAKARELAHEVGFFVIEQSGEAVQLAERPPWFKPQEW